jgi:hypothetical protein
MILVRVAISTMFDTTNLIFNSFSFSSCHYILNWHGDIFPMSSNNYTNNVNIVTILLKWSQIYVKHIRSLSCIGTPICLLNNIQSILLYHLWYQIYLEQSRNNLTKTMKSCRDSIGMSTWMLEKFDSYSLSHIINTLG